MRSEGRWLLSIVMAVMLAVTMLFNPAFVIAAENDEGGDAQNGNTITFVNSDGTKIEALVSEDGFIYENVNSDGTEMIKVIGYTGDGSTIDIPEEINGIPVMSVGIDPRYPGVKGLDYDNITTIKFPASVVYAKSSCLKQFDNLTSITVAEGNPVFSAKEGVLYKVFEDSPEYIDAVVYPAAKADTEWVMPNNVIKCTNLPAGVPLKKITVSAAIERCGYSTFRNLEKLEEIVVPNDNITYSSENGVLFDKEKTILKYCPRNKQGETLTIPETVVEVSDSALRGGRNFNTIEFTAQTAPEKPYGYWEVWALRDYYLDYGCDFDYPKDGTGYSEFVAWLKGKELNDIYRIIICGCWVYDDDPYELVLGSNIKASVLNDEELDGYVKFSQSEDGPYDKEAPDEVGTWYIKAFTDGTDTVLACESDPFEINVVEPGKNESGQNYNYFIAVSQEYWEYTGEQILVEAYTLFGDAKIEFRLADSEEEKDWTTEQPTKIGSYAYRVTVDETDEYEGLVHVSDEGCYIEICKAWNDFDEWGCEDVVAGEEPQPYAVPRYGNPDDVQFRYIEYIDEEGHYDEEMDEWVYEDTIYMDSYPTEPGEYAVEASIEGGDTYTPASELIWFNVISEEEKAEQDAAEAVRNATNAIKALPEVAELTLDDEEAVNEAKGLYDALTEDQKDVFNQKLVKKLNNAVAKIDELKNPEHIHSLEAHEAVEATCTAEGTKAYWTCSVCKKMFSDAEGKTEIDNPETIDKVPHDWETRTEPATLTKDGEKDFVSCKNCGTKKENGKTIYSPKDFSVAAATYNGKELRPAVTVTDTEGNVIDASNYTVTYSDNINAGTEAKAVVKFSGTMYSGEKALTFTINKAAQTVKAKVATKTVKVKKVKKKAQTVTPITSVTKKAGAVTYKKVSGSAKLTVNKTTGKVTVKKKTKKGTYKAKIRVTAAGSANYKSAYTDVTVTIKVKK